jgi:peptidoglycan hydrolase CwlO-like protein
MRFDSTFTPEPSPMPTEMPDLGPAVDVGGSIAGIVTLIIVTLGTLAWRRLSAWVTEMKTDVKITKVQTTNSHETNLRDDLTDAISKIESMATSVSEMGESLKSLDNRQAEMHGDLRETRKDLRFTTEYVRDVDKRLNQHLDESRKKGGSSGSDR